MILPLREIDVLGVFVAPFALCVPIAVAATCGTLVAMRRLPPRHAWTRSPLMELALFISVLSGLVLLLGRL